MIPKLIPQPKWFKSSPDIKEDDVVFFQKIENDISSEWTIGQVESITKNKDKKIRRVEIRYFNHGQDVPRMTERSVRSLVRLFNIEDDYFVRDMDQVEILLKELEHSDKSEQVGETENEALGECLDNDGEDEIVDGIEERSTNVSTNSCKCCCEAHCKLTAHTDITRVVYGTSLAKYIAVPTMLEMPYSLEKVQPGDTMIRPAIALESVDEMYESLTALQTDFSLE